MNEREQDIEFGERTRELFTAQVQRINKWTDRFFAGLLFAQWLMAVGVALWVSPLTWEGSESRVHAHVWTALFLGGLIVFPVILILLRGVHGSACYLVAAAQMLIGSLLIHLTGGRIETHFHVFGSLALLAFYRDWKVLIVASAVTGLDHFLRGSYWPRSVFGVSLVSPWRWVEHLGWVVFEDVFLIWSCFRSVAEMQEVARNRAELEATRERVEATVLKRTGELRRGELRYRTLIEATSAIVWNTPTSGEFEFDQPGWSGFTGQTFEQLKGWGWLDAVHPDDRARTACAWSEAVANRCLYQVEHRVRRHDGEYRHMQGRGVPIADDSGAVAEWFGIHGDVDAQTRAMEAMTLAREAAEAASRAKGEFLANMSHEIRTPMNGIIGMTELALDTQLSAQQRDYLLVVKDSSEALLCLINDILDFSKIEAGKLDLDPVPFRLRDCVEETLRVLALRAHVKGLDLSGRVAPEVPDFVIGDAGRLRQVLVNLVGNAIKFTERGEVAVSVDRAGVADVEGELTIRLSVRDSGIGISPEKLRAIFEPFEQADGSTTRKYGGTGLGLTISQKLVELMGGKFSVESRPGRGSTFTFEARLKLQPESPGQDRRDPKLLHGVPILVVDDNQTNRQILKEILENWGALPTTVDGGRAALEMFRAARAEGRPFRIVLLDGMMPEMDGYEVVREMAGDQGLVGPVVVMITSNDEVVSPTECQSRGITARLIKPIRQSELFEVISNILEPRESKAISEPDSLEYGRTAPSHTYSILLAEDNRINQQVVTNMLIKRGHRVTVTSDGRQALEARNREQFDLVLMDIQMPEMDGFETVAAIRKDEESGVEHVPIIALTAHAMKGDSDRCLASGFDAYVSKPVRSELLFEAIDGLLGRAPVSEPSSKDLPEFRTSNAFDLASALESMGGDEELFREILHLFLEECPKLLDKIESAIEADNPSALRQAAHMLRGTAGHFAANGIVAAARRLEEAGKTTSCRSAGPEVSALVRALDQFFEALGDLAPAIPPWRLSIVNSRRGAIHAEA
ncbi:response regulator [Tundrisphaera lichenicola]|uniref:hybrid sensor histidine kinase/response regulator n=1 Tax=Tundrisphaera lichenicola TaxID=2029860 RepID=UPI003EBDF897